MKAPKKISRPMICVLTHYDNMTNEERGIVFKAYSYNKEDESYELKKPEILTENIIKKLI